MLRGRVGAVVLALIVAACTTVAPSPPRFVELTSGTPSTYRLQRVAWPVGRTLVYRATEYSETTLEGEAPSRRSETHTVSLTAGQETAQGLRRVDLALDGQRVASMFLTSAGELRDASAELPAFATMIHSIVATAGVPAIGDYFSSTLTKGQRYEARVSSRHVFTGWGLDYYMNDELRFAYELVAYRVASERRVAEVHSSFPNSVAKRFDVPLSPNLNVTVHSLSGTGRYYNDLTTGVLIAKYEVTEISGYSQRRAVVHRTITSADLDMAASRF